MFFQASFFSCVLAGTLHASSYPLLATRVALAGRASHGVRGPLQHIALLALPTTLAHETLALHAMNAVMVKLRQRAMTTSHGLVSLASLASFLLFACAFPRSDAVLVSLWLLPDISILGNTRPELSFLDNMPACALPRFMGSLLLCFGSSP